MDAIEFLTKDHEAVKALFAAANTYDQMKAAFGETSRILETHTGGTIFLSSLRRP